MPFIPLNQSDAPRGFIPLKDAQGDTSKDTEDKPSSWDGALKTLEAIGQVYPVAETAANLGTQIVSLPAAGLAGLGAMATNAMGITNADPAAVVQDVGHALTYQPRTDLGQHLTNVVTYPLQLLAEAGQKAGDATFDATGSPTAATAVDTAIQAVPILIAPAIKGVKAIKSGRVEVPVAEPASEASPRPGFTPMDAAQVEQAAKSAAEENRVIPKPTPAQENASTAILEARPSAEIPENPGKAPEAASGAQGFTAVQGGADSATISDPRAAVDASVLSASDTAPTAPGAQDAMTVDPALAALATRDQPAVGATDQTVSAATPEAAAQQTAAAEVQPTPQIQPDAVPQTARSVLFGRPVSDYTDAELSRFSQDYRSSAVTDAVNAELTRRASDIQPMVSSAAADLSALANKGADVHSELTQAGVFDQPHSPEALDLVDFLAAHPERTDEFLQEYQHALSNPEPRSSAEPNPTAERAPADSLGQSLGADGGRQPGNAAGHQAGDQGAGAAKYTGVATDQQTPADAPPAVQNAWAPGANYAPLMDEAKTPESTASTSSDLPAPIRREHILADFSKALDTTIYQGRVQGKRLGFFRPRTEEVRIKRANDIEVAAHEVAHLVDSRVPAIANAWRTDKALREELKSVSYDHKDVREGFAEAVRLYLTQPETLAEKAPKAHAWLENFAKSHEYGPALRKAQKQMTSWYGQDALNRARSKIGSETPMAEHFDRLWDRFRQATVDDLHGVYAMERDIKGKTEPNGPYESARLARASTSIADGAIRYGYPVKKADGSFTFKGKGLEQILKPVSGDLEDALLYFVGRSANELMAQGREHLFTDGEIKAMLKLATPERKQAFQEYQAWNKGILDFAEAQGVINPESRKAWQRTQYLPFHRVGQPGEFKGGKPGDWSGVKALTGGTENIRDVLSSMVQNAAQLIDKAVKNEARVKIADLADKAKGGRFMVKIPAESRPVKIDPRQAADGILKALGINRAEWTARGQKLPRFAEKLVKELQDAPDFLEFVIGNQPPAGHNVVAVLRSGKPEWYEVGDPLLYRALSSIDRKNQHWLIKWLGLPKRIGQASITAVPDFWIRNIARDTIMGSVMSQHGFKPVVDSLRGMRMRIMNDPIYRDYLANGGGLSSIYLDEAKLRAKLEKFYTRQGISLHTVLDTPEKLLGFIETLGDSFEMSTRLGEYKRAIDAGEHPRHAAYLGREVSTDFAMRGDSQALGMMYDTVMFLKAATLSWDRLARGFAHDPNRGAIAIKTGALALASAALYLLNRNNPQYQDLPDWDKDSNWHFFIDGQHFRYPKIWEIGALSSAAERTVGRILDDNPGKLGQDFGRIIANNFNLNLMPQIVAPLYEQATNKNSFTGAPIETPGMENVQPFLRAKPGTSETMKALGMATANLPESLQVNPVRAEALLRGYFNTWAMYGLMLSDKAFFNDRLPAKRADELPVVRSFYENEPAKHTKYEDQFYNMLDEAQRLHGTLRELDRIGRSDMADTKEQDVLSDQAKPLQRAAKNLQGINADMRAVRRDPTLTADEKRARLDDLTVQRNDLLKRAVQDTENSMKEKTQ